VCSFVELLSLSVGEAVYAKIGLVVHTKVPTVTEPCTLQPEVKVPTSYSVFYKSSGGTIQIAEFVLPTILLLRPQMLSDLLALRLLKCYQCLKNTTDDDSVKAAFLYQTKFDKEFPT
jgi:hypothetical protein